ncbi:MAG: ATP-binding cassette domain-containing protein [Lachnospiraceae bacterium]
MTSYRYEPDARPPLAMSDAEAWNGAALWQVLGHNGSGKSTLAKLMNAPVPAPRRAGCWCAGMVILTEEKVWNIRRHAGMVFQNPDNQIVANVVREDVAFGLENLGVPQDEMVRRVERQLSAASHERASCRPRPICFPRTARKQLAIAGALAMEPELIIMDEATAMLDPSGRAEVLATVRKLNREKGMTVVWITHFMEEAAVADRLVVMNDGSVAMEGTPRQVFSRVEEIKALGLDVPPMAELAQTLRDKGLPLPEGILTVSDMVKELKNVLCPSK